LYKRFLVLGRRLGASLRASPGDVSVRAEVEARYHVRNAQQGAFVIA
jgi:hypothetical protein